MALHVSKLDKFLDAFCDGINSIVVLTASEIPPVLWQLTCGQARSTGCSAWAGTFEERVLGQIKKEILGCA